jgi:hypothetical protein
MTTALQCIGKFLKKQYTLAGFEPGIFCSVGGRDDRQGILYYFVLPLFLPANLFVLFVYKTFCLISLISFR